MTDSAVVSPCGTWRYRLDRTLDPARFITEPGDEPPLLFVMLNPSIADAETDDPTIRCLKGFTWALGSSRFVVVNLYAYRATSPSALLKVGMRQRVGPCNDATIELAADEVHRNGGGVIVAWGARAIDGPAHASRVHRVLGLLRGPDLDRPLYALGVTASGQPRHPLYLLASARPRHWSPPR